MALTRKECAAGFAQTSCDSDVYARAYPPLALNLTDKKMVRDALWLDGSIAEIKDAYYVEVRKRNPAMNLSDGDINRDKTKTNSSGLCGFGGQTHVNNVVNFIHIQHTHMLGEHARTLQAIEDVETFEQAGRPRKSQRLAHTSSNLK